MSDSISSMFGLTLPHGKMTEFIMELESALKMFNETPYHAIIGRNMLNAAPGICNAMICVYDESISKVKAQALYIEINGFAINPDRWYANVFGYTKGGNLWDFTWNLDWASDWQYESDDIQIDGLEDIQMAFDNIYSSLKAPLGLKIAGELAEHLMVARFCEAVKAAHQMAIMARSGIKGIPVISTAHEWDRVSPLE